MTKHFCDRCGEEVPQHALHHYSVKGPGDKRFQIGKRERNGAPIYAEYDLCSMCVRDFKLALREFGHVADRAEFADPDPSGIGKALDALAPFNEGRGGTR